MIPYDIIRKKQQGKEHHKDEIDYLIQGFTSGKISDYQMAAWLMAVYFQGLSDGETSQLVTAMIRSGKSIDLSDIPGPKIDKHSTGGVGDKVSLVLGPLVAAAGVKMPMISGRGLGHTGGTLDKLESIPGFKTHLSIDEFKTTVEKIGVSIMSQTDEMVPADKKMYALRDTTATVRSIPLICGSIMSKKIAEGIDGLVFDVKTGSGAFMGDFSEATQLAHRLVEIGKEFNIACKAVITDMNQPLGTAVGNWNEVLEAARCLNGQGPADLLRVTLELGAEVLLLAGKSDSKEQAQTFLESLIEDGYAIDKFWEFVENQGGKREVVLQSMDISPANSDNYHPVLADREGYVTAIDTYALGMASMQTGAGRQQMGDMLDYKSGLTIHKKIGDQIKSGEVLVGILTSKDSEISEIAGRIQRAYIIQGAEIESPPLVYEVIG